MKSVRLPNPVAPGLYAGESGELLVFYLAMEEYLAAHLAKLVAPGPDGRLFSFGKSLLPLFSGGTKSCRLKSTCRIAGKMGSVFSDVKAGEGAFIPIMGT